MKMKLAKYFRPFSLSAASILLVVASLLSYLAGFLRDLILSFYFGATSITDVYNTAFLIPDILFNFTVSAALGGAFLPIFRGVYLKNKEEAQNLAGAFLLTSQILIIVLAGLSYWFMPNLVSMFFGKATLSEQVLIIDLSRIMLLSPILFSLSNTIGAVLMSFKHYFSYALSAALYNFGIILGIILFNDEYGIYSAAYGVVIGLVLHLLVRFIDLFFVEFKFNFCIWSPKIWQIVKLSVPRSFGLVSTQLSLLAFTIVGYSLIEGSIAAFNLARNLQSFAVSLFGIAVATAVFPFLIDHNEKNETANLLNRVNNSFLQIWFYTLPSAIGLLILSTQIVKLLFERGMFNETAVVLTSTILAWFSLSIPFESSVHLLSRVFYVFKNTWSIVWINLSFLCTNLIFAFLLARQYGAFVFGISFAVGNFIQMILMWFSLKKFLSLKFSLILFDYLKIVFASFMMGVVIFVLNIYFNVIFVIGIGLIFYFIMAFILGILKYAGLERFKVIKKFIR